MDENITEFISGLRKVKNIYACCPSCGYMFSLYNARLIYGKNPPRDMLSEMETKVRKANERFLNLQDKQDELASNWRDKLDQVGTDFKNKIMLLNEKYNSKERTLNEKLRHLKSDVAATNKEVIREKVDLALIHQRGTIEGHIAELFPMFNRTHINPADLLALVPTKPIDFVVFHGLFNKEVTKITFLDVKKGTSQLTHTQKTIRDTIGEGNVEFKKLRVNFNKVEGAAEEEN